MSRKSHVLATKTFARWMRKSKVNQEDLIIAIQEMADGLIDAHLGGHLVKKRVALQGRGKSAGVRTIIATQFESRWIYLFGFEKSERSNIDRNELKALQELAKSYLELSAAEIQAAVKECKLIELNGEVS